MAGLFDPSSIYFQLANAGLLPTWAQQRPTTGADGVYNPDTNRLTALPPSSPFNKTTLAHELTHASQYNFLYPAFNSISDKLKKGSDITSEERQYYEAAKKILNEQPSSVGMYSKIENKVNSDSLKKAIDSLYKIENTNKSKEEYKSYRTQPHELQAFGVGNMSQGGMHGATKKELIGSNYYPHLDPSFATEFDIIMSLYNKLPNSVKETIVNNRKESIEGNKKYYKDTFQPYKFEDRSKDPFISSIK